MLNRRLLASCSALIVSSALVLAVSAPAADTTQTTLTVFKLGTGTGSVTSDPAGINCGTVCSGQFPVGTPVQLTLEPAAGSELDGLPQHCQMVYPPKLLPGMRWTPRCRINYLTDERAVKVIFNLTSTPCLVPRVKGRTLAKAEFLLALGSCGHGATWSRISSKVKKGRVIYPFPRAGSQLEHGWMVNLILSKGRR